MSGFNQSNAGYLPMANHGEFSNVPPSQAPFMFYNAPTGYEANQNPSAFAMPFASAQDCTMLQQHDQVFGNTQQQEQYASHYSVLPFPVSAHQTMSHSSVSPAQNSQSISSSVHNSHPPRPQIPWRPPDQGHPQLNPTSSPTGQRYSTVNPFSVTNPHQPYTHGSEQTSMIPSSVVGRYQSGSEMQNQAYSNNNDSQRQLQSPHRRMQSPQSQTFAPVSHGSPMPMAQHFQSMNMAQGMATVSTTNSLHTQSEMISNNFQQSNFSQRMQGVQMGYDNGSSVVESRVQPNYNISYQNSTKGNKPNTVQSVKRPQASNNNHRNQTLSNNQKLKDSKVSQKASHSPSNLMTTPPPKDAHNVMFSQGFQNSLMGNANSNRQDDMRQKSLPDRRSTALSVGIMGHENFNGTFLMNRGRPVESVGTERGRNNNTEVNLLNRPLTQLDRATAQSGSGRGAVSQRGNTVRGRGAVQGISGRSAARGAASFTAGRGQGQERPVPSLPIRENRRISNEEVNPVAANNQTSYRPGQWYKHPDSAIKTYQSDMEAMKASNAVEDHLLSNGTIQATSLPQGQEHSITLKSRMPPLISTANAHDVQVAPLELVTSPRKNLTNVSNSTTPSNNSLSTSSSLPANRTGNQAGNHTLTERFFGTAELNKNVVSAKVNMPRIKGEPHEASDVNDSPRSGTIGASIKESERQNSSSVVKSSGIVTAVGSTSSSCSSIQNNASSLTSSSINAMTVTVSASLEEKEKGRGDLSSKEQTSPHGTFDIDRLINSCLPSPPPLKSSTSAQADETPRETSDLDRLINSCLPSPPPLKSTTSTQANSTNSKKPVFRVFSANSTNTKSKSENPIGLSARDKVFSMWKAGQVVGRTPSKGRKRLSEEQTSTYPKSAVKERTPLKPHLAEKSNQDANEINSPNELPTVARQEKDQVPAPFPALFHGHKIMAIPSKQGSLVVVYQFIQECFPEKGKGSVSNCINRALRIKKKPIEHLSKDKIISYLKNNLYLVGHVESEPVCTISLHDAKRVYHYINGITNCASESCVVLHRDQCFDLDAVVTPAKKKTVTQEIIKRVKKENKSADDRYGRMSRVRDSQKNMKDRGNTSIPGGSTEALEKNTSQNTEERNEEGEEDLILVEGLENPFFLRSDATQKKVGRVCNTLIGQIRSYHHDEENYLVVQDLCDTLGYDLFMSVIDKDCVDLYSCCNDVLSFLNTMQSGFVQLTSGQNSLVKEKDVGSYSCDDSTDTNTICPVKKVICKKEVIEQEEEEEMESNPNKRPRLELETLNSNNLSNITLPTSECASVNRNTDSSFFSTTVQGPVSINSGNLPELNTSMTTDNDQAHKKIDNEVQRVNSEAKKSVPSNADDSGTIMVFDVSCITKNKDISALSLSSQNEQMDVESLVPSRITEAIIDGNIFSTAEISQDKTSTPKHSAKAYHSSAATTLANVTPIRADNSPVALRSGDKTMDGVADNQENKTLIDQQNKTVEPSDALQSHASAPNIDSLKSKNILTVIDNPYKANQTIPVANVKMPMSGPSTSGSAQPVRKTDNTANAAPTSLRPALICPEEASTSQGTNSTAEENKTELTGSQMSLNVTPNVIPANVGSSLKPQNVNIQSSLEHSTKDIPVVANDKGPSCPNPLSSSSLIRPSPVKTPTTAGLKRQNSAFDSSSPCTSFLQAACSSSFELEPKIATAGLKYCADDLELLSHGGEANRTKQSLMKETIVLRYKNKTLQDMVKHLRRELLSSKEKHETSLKKIKYYENVLQDITATFMEVEPEAAATQPKIGPEQLQSLSRDSPIVIDDD